MKVGNHVMIYNALDTPNVGQRNYKKTLATVIRVLVEKEQLKAIEIRKLFNIKPGEKRFVEFYATEIESKRAVVRTQDNPHMLIYERMWKSNGIGDDCYVVILPNSVSFLLED